MARILLKEKYSNGVYLCTKNNVLSVMLHPILFLVNLLKYGFPVVRKIDILHFMSHIQIKFDVTCILLQTFYPLLRQAASQSKDAPMSCNRAAVINISSDLGSITENTFSQYNSYRAAKVLLNACTMFFFTH